MQLTVSFEVVLFHFFQIAISVLSSCVTIEMKTTVQHVNKVQVFYIRIFSLSTLKQLNLLKLTFSYQFTVKMESECRQFTSFQRKAVRMLNHTK